MNQSALSPETIRARIEQIRTRLGVVESDRWSHEFREDGEFIIVTRAVMDATGRRVGNEAPVELCRFGPEAAWQEAELVREARDDIRFLLDTLSDAGRQIRDLRKRLDRADAAEDKPGRAAKDYAAEASMKCGEASFQRFLAERHASDDDGDLRDTAAAGSVLRRALAIGSRKDLNTDPEAAQRWRDLRAEFQAWERGDGA
jgi:hypothetical protein